ncbi:alpha/beta hydrolase [Promicromonospora kroppenstedtii]|uniref:Alpha/beta hydrolase n=1 Tax=Promicromonospora kroppenstedtii TaxID=440482 RepID=A0ABW7XMC1_9MICO
MGKAGDSGGTVSRGTPGPQEATGTEAGRPAWLTWSVRVVGAAGIGVVAWACLTAWGAVVHGHPLYAVLLGLTVLGSVLVLWRSLRPRPTRRGWRLAGDLALVVAGIVWAAAMAWLRPFTAVEPALDAMVSDDSVTVTESTTAVTLAPARGADGTAVFFRPGAKVEARAYAAVLRPVAEAGHTVVIPKQPLAVAFLAGGAFDAARERVPQADRWVVGGHSLGGVVASSDAAGAEASDMAPAVGLLLYASYPAEDLSGLTVAVESVSASQDGLATPAEIEASRAVLPADATFTVVEGAVHAFFGDYGPQPGDGTPTTTHDEARAEISSVSTQFVDSLAG